MSLVIHARELKRTTNTGTLAIKALNNSTLSIRGLERVPLDLRDVLDSKYHPLYLYPGTDADELTKEIIPSDKQIQLIVPDGNWRQASKVYGRHPELSHVRRVKISIPNRAKWHMRKESSEMGMSTLQAIAYALAVIEGEAVGEELQRLYQLKLQRTWQGRGEQINPDRNFEAAKEAAP